MAKENRIKSVFILVTMILLTTALMGQAAHIIENIIPTMSNITPFMVKQGAGGNMYMTLNLIQGSGSLPTIYKGYCIVNPQGQALHYYSAGFDEAEELGYQNNMAFCLENGTFRIPYVKTLQDSAGTIQSFNWCTYNPATGHTFQPGFQTRSPLFSYLTDVIRLNANKWIVSGTIGYNQVALCVNAAGDSLWSFSIPRDFNYHKWVKRVSDNRVLFVYCPFNLSMRVQVVDDNGQEIWHQTIGNGNPPHVEHIYLGDFYADDRAIMAYDICTGERYVTEYYNNTLTELFQTPALNLWNHPTAYCDLNGFMFSQWGGPFKKFDFQGNLQWQYTMPDSFELPGNLYQIGKTATDSCYLVIGNKYTGYDPVEECSTYNTYLLRLPFNLTANAESVLPQPERLLRTFPNPFKEKVSISFDSNKAESVEFRIYNIKGQLVKSYDRFIVKYGINRLEWDGRDSQGKPASRGLYIIKVKSSASVITAKCLKME